MPKSKTQIQVVLGNLATKNERIFRVVLQDWMFFTIKQIQQDLTRKYIKKDITSELTDWDFIEEQGKRIIKPATLKIMQSAGNQAYKQLAVTGSFDVLNVYAIKAADKFGATLVKDVTANTKKGVRTFVREGINAGKGMDKIARELRPIVGLTKRQTESIIGYRRLLGEKFPDLTAAQVNKKVITYTNKTHRQRMENIARTETANAQNIGYCQGLAEVGVAEAEFLVSPTDYCEQCEALNGTRYPVAEAEGIITVHPRCRCVMLPVIGEKPVSQMLESTPPELPGVFASPEGKMSWPKYRSLHQGEKSSTGLLYDYYKIQFETTGKMAEGTKKFLRAKAPKYEATSLKISKPIPGLGDIIKPIKVPPGPKQIKLPAPKLIYVKPKPKAIPKPKPKPKELTQRQWEASLTDDEVHALTIWSESMEGTEMLKDYQIGRKVSAYMKKVGQTFDDALKRAPNFEGIVYRGHGLPYDKGIDIYKKGSTIRFDTVASASRKKSVAKEFRGFANEGDRVPIEMVIRTKTGVRIHNIADQAQEAEVLLRKGSKFKVVKEPEWIKFPAYEKGGYYRIHLEEIVVKPKPKPVLPKTKFATAEDYRQALLKLETGKTTPAELKELAKLKAKRLKLDKKAVDQRAKWWDAKKDPKVSETELRNMYHALQSTRRESQQLYAKQHVMVMNRKVSLKEARSLLNEVNNMAGTLKSYQVDKWGDVADDILSWVPRKVLQESERNNIKYLSTYKGTSIGQAGSYARDGHIISMGSAQKRVFAHELGHHLGYQIRGAMRTQTQFFKARTASEYVDVKLPGYTKIFGKKDKFKKYDVYAGRTYKAYGARNPECISVGIEHIWKNPISAAKKDPEWFRMIMSAIKKIPQQAGQPRFL